MTSSNRLFSLLHSITPLFVSALFLHAISCSPGQEADEKMMSRLFTPEELKSDLQYLITTLEKRHVNFYQRANPDSIANRKSRLLAQLNQPMNRADFFKAVAVLNPYFNDAHCLLFPLREEAAQEEKAGIRRFPFSVVLKETGQVHLERDYQRTSDEKIVRKDWPIDSINGQPIGKIIDRLAHYSHGETMLLRRHMTTLLFSDWLYSIFSWRGRFEIVFNNGADRLTIETKDDWRSLEKDALSFNQFEVLQDVGYLRLNSFDVDDQKEAYEQFIDASFARLKKEGISKLLIDVRGNTGGQSDAGAYVIQYLIDQPANQVSLAYQRIHEGNAGWFHFRGQPGDLKEMDVAHEELIDPVSKDKRFEGQVVVLSDEMTYSAGIIFITVIQDHRLATLMGRPTGGFANQTGNIESFSLPHTKLMVYAPARTFVRVSKDASIHVVTPEILIHTPDSVTTTDYVLERALDELRK
jgi:hypothetical protein